MDLIRGGGVQGVDLDTQTLQNNKFIFGGRERENEREGEERENPKQGARHRAQSHKSCDSALSRNQVGCFTDSATQVPFFFL